MNLRKQLKKAELQERQKRQAFSSSLRVAGFEDAANKVEEHGIPGTIQCSPDLFVGLQFSKLTKIVENKLLEPMTFICVWGDTEGTVFDLHKKEKMN